MTPCLIYAGAVLDLEGISTFKEVLCFVEGLMKEKLASDVLLSSYRGVYKVSWNDGEEWRDVHFYMPSTTKASA